MRIFASSVEASYYKNTNLIKTSTKKIGKTEYQVFIYLFLDSMPNKENLVIRKVKLFIPLDHKHPNIFWKFLPKSCLKELP